MPIPYGRQSIDDDDIAAVVKVLRGDWLTQGPAVAAFEDACAAACGAPHAVAFSSGTAALHAACHAAGLGPGDEVITSGMTFAASANCAAYVSATPTFADIDPATWNVTAATVAAAAGARTRAVVPVDFAGLPAPVAEIRAALGPDVVVIEDAAHALGARRRDGPVGDGAHADMTMFSFHPVKAVTAGEAGIITTRDAGVRDALRDFRSHGMTRALEHADGGWSMEQRTLGFNYRLTDIHSALGRSQLTKLDRFVAARNAVADRYRAGLAGLGAIALPPAAPAGALHAYHLFAIRHRGGADARRALYDGLRERGILVQVHYLPPYLHPWYRETYGYGPGLCPAAEDYYAGCLSLPCFPSLSGDEQATVIAAVRELAG